MKNVLASLTMVCTLLTAGCASVQLQQGKDVSTAGIAYAQATAKVVDLAIDTAIDANNERRTEFVPLPASTQAEKDSRRSMLLSADTAQIAYIKSFAELKQSVSITEAYFNALQQLASATPGVALEASVKGLAESVNATSEALARGKQLNEAQSSALSGLAKLVITQIHGQAVERALKRDAEVIGRALVLQEMTLRSAKAELGDASRYQDSKFHEERIVKPYVAGAVGKDWAADRKAYIKSQAMGTALQAVEAAEIAARQMQSVWALVIGGETSGAAFGRLLTDVGAALDAALAVKKAF